MYRKRREEKIEKRSRSVEAEFCRNCTNKQPPKRVNNRREKEEEKDDAWLIWWVGLVLNVREKKRIYFIFDTSHKQMEWIMIIIIIEMDLVWFGWLLLLSIMSKKWFGVTQLVLSKRGSITICFTEGRSIDWDTNDRFSIYSSSLVASSFFEGARSISFPVIRL